MSGSNLTRKTANSILLMAYMLIAFIYYLIDAARGPLYGIILGISVLAFFTTYNARIKVNPKWILFFSICFILGLFIQLFNGTFTPFILYLIASPCFAYFVYYNKFNVSILSYPIYLISAFFFFYFLSHRTLIGVFPTASVNYVSVVMIMNAILLAAIERNQGFKIKILPSILALIFSLLAMGRAGILCSGLLFFAVMWVNWNGFSKTKKIGIFMAIIIPLFFIVASQWDIIVSYFQRLSFLERFDERGIDSPSRDILKREYTDHLNLETLFWGYNFERNYWFIHYGLNPHNSYIRLHYYLGALFFLIIPIIIYSGIQLLRKDKFIFILLLVILLRGWTDSILFLALYDFILVLVLFYGLKADSTKNINLAHT